MSPMTQEQMDAGRKRAIEVRRRESEMKRKKIEALMALGMSQSEVARELGMKRQSVNRIVKRER